MTTKVLSQQPGPLRAAALVESPRPAGHWGASITDDRYSRRVALLKRVLPAIGLTLLLMIAGWPRLAPLLESVRLGAPAIDLREARELRMVNPRYAGLDRYNRPYVVTAATGRQVPDRDDVMALERPKAVMTVHGGVSVVVTAATGIYQSQPQLLDLFEDVNLVREDATRFVTRRAHLNLSDNSAEGHDPVEGHGPSGDINGEGFLILSKGDTIIFTGRSHLLLKGTNPGSPPVEPPPLPPEIANMAAKVEATAVTSAVAQPVPRRSPGAVEKPLHAKPVARTHAAAKPRLAVKQTVKMPPSSKPAAAKAKHNAG